MPCLKMITYDIIARPRVSRGWLKRASQLIISHLGRVYLLYKHQWRVHIDGARFPADARFALLRLNNSVSAPFSIGKYHSWMWRRQMPYHIVLWPAIERSRMKYRLLSSPIMRFSKRYFLSPPQWPFVIMHEMPRIEKSWYAGIVISDIGINIEPLASMWNGEAMLRLITPFLWYYDAFTTALAR